MARVRARAVHLHGINTLYHAVSVYTGMHKTLETLETLALRARVSKPVSAVLYIPVYTSTAWYNRISNVHNLQGGRFSQIRSHKSGKIMS